MLVFHDVIEEHLPAITEIIRRPTAHGLTISLIACARESDRGLILGAISGQRLSEVSDHGLALRVSMRYTYQM